MKQKAKKLIGKITSVLLIACMLMGGGVSEVFDLVGDGIGGITANAATYGDYEYEVTDDNTIEITKYKGNGGAVTIPSEINGKKVTSIGDYAFSYCTGLTSITIPDSVTSIGYRAFNRCKGLTSITIPDSVTIIGLYAFAYCTGLTSITIPDSVTSIGDYAFSGCTGLTSINVYNKNTKYSSSNGILFDKNKTELICCPGGKKGSIRIPDSVTSIGGGAFYKCTGLTSITIPDSVTSIEWGAFYGCTGLTSITIPDSVTSIGHYVFSGCKKITIYGYKDSCAERYANENNIPFCAIGNTVNSDAYRYYFSKKRIVPGDTFIVGADKLGGNYTGTYYPGPGKVEWEISDRDVIDFVPINGRTVPYYEDSTQLHLKAKKFGESKLTLKLNGKTVCSETIRVTLPKEKIFNDYKNELFKTNVMGILQNGMDSGTKIINNYSEDDKDLISFMTALKEDLGIKVILKYLLSKIDLTSSMLDDAVDDVVAEMMYEYLNTEEFLNGTVSDINKKYKNLMKVSKFTALVDDREKITKLGKELKKYSSFSESKIGDLLGKLNKHVGKGLNLAELGCTAIMLAQIDRDAVCHLMTTVAVGGGYCSDVYNGLSRLLDKIDNLDTYIMEKYFTDELMDKFFELAEDLVGGTTLKTTKIIAGIISLVYSVSGGKTADEFLKAYSAQSLANYTKFGLQKATNESDNELEFGLYKAAVKNYMNNCINLADIKGFNYTNKNKFKQLKAAAKSHSDLIDDYCTYEHLIEEAKALASGQALADYVPGYSAYEKNLSARYNTKTGKFEVIKTTSSSAGASENDQINIDDYIIIPAAFEDNKVISIADHGFEGITNKKGVVFPDTIESVGDYSFSDSTGLISVSLNHNLQSIGEGAFRNCTSITDIIIPDKLRIIGNNAFENCSSISYLSLDADTIGNNAFLNCSSLSEVRFNNRNTVIGSNAFDGCSNDLIITGYTGSTAEKYAEANNIVFEAVPEYIESLSIVTPASKTEYTAGDEIDTDGLTIKAVYKDGRTETLSDGWITAFDTSSAGNSKVYIIYGEKSVSYDITVTPAVPATITLDNTRQEMMYGTGTQIHASALSPVGKEVQLVYTSSDTDIAEVNMTGYVRANKPGNAQITVQTVTGDSKAVCDITVSDKEIFNDEREDRKIIFMPTRDNYYLIHLETQNPNAILTVYDEYENKVLKERTDDRNLTAILSSGSVYTVSVSGTTGKNDYIRIEEYEPTSDVLIADNNGKTVSSLTKSIGDTFALSAKTPLQNSIKDTYYWESDNNSIAAIDQNGKITCNSAGTTTIHLRTSHFAEAELKLTVKNQVIQVASVKLSKTSATIDKGKTLTLTATITPTDAANKNLTWTSSNTKVATVSGGKVTAVAAGTAAITAKSNNGKTATCNVTVKNPVITATSIKLDKTLTTLGKGETITLKATTEPSNTTNKTVTWTSSNAKVATVDTNGKVDAKETGTVTVTAKTSNGKTATCKITVKAAPSSVTLSKTSLSLGVGETFSLSSSIPANTAAAVRTFSSSDSSVVKMTKTNWTGEFKAMKVGTAKVTVKLYNGKTAACTVTVKAAPASVSLPKTSTSLGVGETYSMGAILPANTAAAARTFSSSNSSVVKMTKTNWTGEFKAMKVGTAKVTVKLYNGKTATCTVTVRNVPASVSLSKTSVSMGVGETFTLSAILPANTAAAVRTYSSSNSSIVQMTRTDWVGTFKAMKVGTAKVTVKLYNGKTATCTVTVKEAPTSVKLNKGNMTLKVGQKGTVSAVIPTNAAAASRTYRSSDPSVVQMTKTNWTGEFVAKKVGTAYVTVRLYNGKEASIKVTVVK